VIIRCSSYEEGSCIYTHLNYQGVQAGFLHEQELDSDTYLTSWLLGKHGIVQLFTQFLLRDPGPHGSTSFFLVDPHST
jgi:hypothetical protein